MSRAWRPLPGGDLRLRLIRPQTGTGVRDYLHFEDLAAAHVDAFAQRGGRDPSCGLEAATTSRGIHSDMTVEVPYGLMGKVAVVRAAKPSAG